MPVQDSLDHAISSTEPDHGVAWITAVLSPDVANVPSLRAPPSTLADDLAHGVETELPASSFRLQFLRAWIAARGGRPAEVAGHA